MAEDKNIRIEFEGKCGAKRYESIDVDMKKPAPDMRHREQDEKKEKQLDSFSIVCSTIAIIISLIVIIKSLY